MCANQSNPENPHRVCLAVETLQVHFAAASNDNDKRFSAITWSRKVHQVIL